MKSKKKEPGDAIVSTILFSDDKEIIHDRVSLKEVNKLTDKEYFVSGCTALLDAVGSSIQHIKKVHNNLADDVVPSKTLFIITTDGMENASREYSYATVKKLIETLTESGWEFIFLGANIDAAKEASKFGISKENAVNYECDSNGVALNYVSLGCAIDSVRKSGSIDRKWRSAIDEDYSKRSKKTK